MEKQSRRSSLFAFLGDRFFHALTQAGLGLLLATTVATCDSPPPSTIGPLLHITLDGVATGGTRVELKVTALGRDKTQDFTADPLNVLGVTFDPGTTGMASIDVQIFDDKGCLLSKGQGMINLASDIDYELPIKMTAVPFCGMPTSKLIVQLVNGADGAGTVTGPGINCGGMGSDCEEIYLAGTQVTLSAVAQKGNFLSWSGSCTGNGGCSIILTPAGDFTVQASFGVCQGWCSEPSGLGTSQINAVYGRGPTDIMVVGNAGSIAHWDGTSWTTLLSGTNKNLLGVTVPRGSSSYVAVGTSGTILGYSGQGWFPIPVTPATTKDLYGVSGVTENEIRIVGQTATLLRGNMTGFAPQGGGEALPAGAGTKLLYGIMVQTNNGTSGEYQIAGASGYTARRNYDIFGNGSWDEAATGTTKDLYSTWYSKSRVVAVGQTGTLLSRTFNVIWQSWKSEMPVGLATNLNGVWGASESSNFTVGDSGKIYRWDGSSWTPMTSGTTNNLLGVWGTSAQNVYAVGQSGTLLHYIQ